MNTIAELSIDRLDTPIGVALVVFDRSGALRAFDFEDHAERMHRLLGVYYGCAQTAVVRAPRDIARSLRRYFAGDLGALSEMRCELPGTLFQRSVWSALRQIAPGRTSTYGELARQLGKPAACRAVGAANGANPIGVVVPCHRVIGSNGDLTGYGGGLHRKRWLLRHEGVQLS